MRRSAAMSVVVAGLLFACRGAPPESVLEALRSCDGADNCAEAVKAARSLTGPARSTPRAVEARLLAMRALLTAAGGFPGPAEAFLAKTGVAGAEAVNTVAADAAEMVAAGTLGAEDAAAVAAFLKEPVCAHLDRVEEIASGSGPFARAAALAEMSVIGQVLAAMSPHDVHHYAEAARGIVGCRMSEMAPPAAVLVELRNRFYDRVEDCATAAGADAAFRASCQALAQLAATHTLPLPLADASSGTVAGAQVAVSTRGIGLSFTPPWILVLSAGRLAVVDQVLLPPGARQVMPPRETQLLDLREPHGASVVQSALHHALSKRKPFGHGGVEVAAVALDRFATASDLFELLEGLLAVSDAIAVAAVLPAGGRAPVFLPLNYRMETRILLNAQGIVDSFPKTGPHVVVEVGPFAATVRSSSVERTVDLPRAGPERVPAGADLRDLYRAVIEAAPAASERGATARVLVEPTVPSALLLGVMEGIAVRVAREALSAGGDFAAATPMRARGSPVWLVPLQVLAPAPPPK